MKFDTLAELIEHTRRQEREVILAQLRALQDGIVARAAYHAELEVREMMKHVAEAGVGNAIKLVEERNKA